MSDDDQAEPTDAADAADSVDQTEAPDEAPESDPGGAAPSAEAPGGRRSVEVPSWAPRALAVVGVLLIALIGFVVGRATDGDGGRDFRPAFSQRDRGPGGPGAGPGRSGGPGIDGRQPPWGPGSRGQDQGRQDEGRQDQGRQGTRQGSLDRASFHCRTSPHAQEGAEEANGPGTTPDRRWAVRGDSLRARAPKEYRCGQRLAGRLGGMRHESSRTGPVGTGPRRALGSGVTCRGRRCCHRP